MNRKMPRMRSRVASPQDALAILERHAKWALAIASLTLVVATLAYLFLPRSYESTTRLLVRVGRESMRPDPTATMGPTIGVTQTRKSELNSEATILRSLDLLQKVASEVTKDPEEQLRVVASLERKLKVQVEEESNVITVQYRAEDADAAQKTLRTLIDEFQLARVRSRSTPASTTFFEHRAQEVAVRIEETRAALREKLDAIGAQALDEHKRSLLARHDSLKSSVAETQAGLSVSRARLTRIEASIEGLDPMQVLEETDGPNPSRDEVEKALWTLRLRFEGASANYHVDSPFMQDLAAQIERTRETLAQLQTPRPILRRGINANRQRLELDRISERTVLAGLEAKLETTHKELANIEKQIAALNLHEGSIVVLEAQLRLLGAERERFLAALEQARADSAMNDERISNIAIIQEPTLPRGPAGPPRMWILVVGVVLAMTSGIGTAFLADFLDSSLQIPSDVTNRLGLPVLAGLPRHRCLRAPIARRLEPGDEVTLTNELRRELGFVVGHALASDEKCTMLAVTSPLERSGVSTIAFHLATRIATAGIGDVLLVDASDSLTNLTRSLQRKPTKARQALTRNLHFLPRWIENCDANTLMSAIEANGASTRFIVIDLGSTTTSGTALEVAKRAHRSLLVLSPKTDAATAERSLSILASHGVELLGAVLNCQELRIGAQP